LQTWAASCAETNNTRNHVVDPSVRRTAYVPVPGREPGLHENRLGDLIGIIPISEDCARSSIDPGRVLFDELAKCRHVVASTALGRLAAEPVCTIIRD
jgi:hypothetical protein